MLWQGGNKAGIYHCTGGYYGQGTIPALPEGRTTIIEQYGGKLIARSENLITLEGPDESRRIVILQFPSVAKAKEFYHSPEYQKARKLREGAADGELVMIEGFKPV